MSNPLTPVLKTGQTGTKALMAALDAVQTVPSFTVAGLSGMPAAKYIGSLVFCSNGNAGGKCLAYCDGTAWLRVAFGASVNTTS